MADGIIAGRLASLPQTVPAVRSAGFVIAATALIALCAHVSFPLFFTPVPLSLQPFAVILVGLLMSPAAAFSTLVLYLLEGASGLPVFTPHGPGGAPQLFGLTGGYLLSYPLVAPLISWLHRRPWISAPGSKSATTRTCFVNALGSAGIGSLVTLAVGALWLGSFTHVALPTLLLQAVLPFLPGDALKVVAAAAISAGIQGWRMRKHRAFPAS